MQARGGPEAGLPRPVPGSSSHARPSRRRGEGPGHVVLALRLLAASACLAPGPAAAAWQSTPLARVAVEGRYDDDTLARGGGAAGILAPSLGWRLRRPRADLQATYGIDVFTYARLLPDTAGANQRLRASQSVDLDRRTRLSLRETAEWLYDPTALARPGVVRTGGEVLFLEAGGEFAHRLSPRLHGAVGLAADASRFTSAAARDGATLAPRARASWALSRRDELGLRYRFQAFAFEGSRPFHSHEPALAYARLLSPTARLALEAGAARVDGPGGTARLAPHGRGELSWRFRHLVLFATGERTLVGAAGLPEPLWASLASLHGEYRITEELTLGIGATAFRNDRADGGRVATGFASEARAEYDLGDGFAARLAVRRVEQRGDGGVGVDLARNIYAAGLTWRYDGPPPR
jgi:hypothetical protein